MKVMITFAAVLAGCGGAAKDMKTDPAGGGGGATAKPVETAASPVDISPVKDDLTVFTDGKSHYYAVLLPDPEKEAVKDPELHLLYGDGKAFYSVPVYTSTVDGLKFEVGFDDPRVPVSPLGSITREHGKTVLTCEGTEVPLTMVPSEDAKKMLAGATFTRRAPLWGPFALARDNDGNYTYVDSGRAVENNAKFRVFAGKKGAMHEIEVVNVEHDDSWNKVTLGTKNGNLIGTMVRPPNGNTDFKLGWDGKPGLFPMDRIDEWKLIFDELGIYPKRTPNPCDPMIK